LPVSTPDEDYAYSGATAATIPVNIARLFNRNFEFRIFLHGGFGLPPERVKVTDGWRSMWEVSELYGDPGSSMNPKEKIETANGCDYYLGDTQVQSYTFVRSL
jgi:hypothetical protein